MIHPRNLRHSSSAGSACGLQLVLLILIAAPLCGEVGRWTHFTIESPLPGESWGTAGPALADFDGDGDLDIAISRRTTQTAYWYERVTDARWVRHTMGSAVSLKDALGAVVADLDDDGRPDVATHRVWFRNPGGLAQKPDTPWPATEYAGGRHDLVAADINRDGRIDILANFGEEWFDGARNLEPVRVFSGPEFHGGVAPGGVGDLDGDGDPDVVVPGFWFANPGNGRGEWQRREWPHLPIPNASYGTSTRTWVMDLNGDGERDIVYSDCDTGNSHVFWVENHGRGLHWSRHQLPDPPTASGDVPGTGSFHSLGIADFDQDGDLDVFAGEQEDPDTYMEKSGKLAMKPRGLKERGVIWENIGTDTQPKFRPVVIHVDNPGWHEAVLGDVDGDGDIDIVSKIWNSDGGSYHADYWRNDNIAAGKQ